MARIGKLLDSAKHQDCIYFTAYIPVQDHLYNKLSIHLKNLWKQQVGEVVHYQDELKLVQDKLLQAIEQELKKIKDLKAGVAIFLAIVKDDLPRLNLKNIEIDVLSRAPELSGYLGEVYDLDQLAALQNFEQKKYGVIDLHQDHYNFYQYNVLDGINLLEKIENEFYVAVKGDYKQKYRSQNKQIAVHGTSNIEHQKLEVPKQLLKKLPETIKNYKCDEYIVVLPSAVAYLKPDIESIFQEFSVQHLHWIEKNLSSQQDVRGAVIAKVEELQSWQPQTLENAEPRLISDWVDVLKAVREGRVARLFVDPKAEKLGFILNRELPFAVAKDRSEKVKNIKPWIVKRVLETHGKIVNMFDSSNNQVIAEVRYRV